MTSQFERRRHWRVQDMREKKKKKRKQYRCPAEKPKVIENDVMVMRVQYRSGAFSIIFLFSSPRPYVCMYICHSHSHSNVNATTSVVKLFGRVTLAFVVKFFVSVLAFVHRLIVCSTYFYCCFRRVESHIHATKLIVNCIKIEIFIVCKCSGPL